jgi:hypothetical protein
MASEEFVHVAVRSHRAHRSALCRGIADARLQVRRPEWRLDVQTTRIVLAMLGALATSVALRARPKELPSAPAPIAAPAGTALLAPDQRLDDAPPAYEYAYHPTLGWRRIVAPPIWDWAPLPTEPFSDLGPLRGTPVLELGSASRASSSDDDLVDHHPVP